MAIVNASQTSLAGMLGAMGPAHHFARVQIQHGCQIQPAGTGTDVRDVADVRQVRRARIELSVQHVGGHWQVVLTVRRMDELALPDRLQSLLAHQTAHLVAPDVEPCAGHGSDQSAASVALMACHKRGPQMNARFAQNRFSRTTLRLVKAGSANVQDATAVLDWDGLLLQLANELMGHFISRAKKAEAFFKMVTSCRSC